ncbi:uncharacterized protein H6S33_005607 [Morchella sextelata]|uniref:uncharacterized protein n=1 Tax=Morchella sextelata TaxID=1174677 RepID=UPI001D05383B|nr:uncharacterized protein H6S33_005607 [Morchella sextelata]KAH0613721.1 hypothetical protein H6S33_005607 [Morchella sextelata]
MHLSITLTLLLSLLCISLAAPTPKPTPAREVATSDKHQVSWGLLANGPAFTGIPVILGAAGSLYLSNATLPAPSQTRLRFELKPGADGVVGAQVMDYMTESESGEGEDMYMFQSAKNRELVYGSAEGATEGKAGPWGYEKMDGNWILALDGDVQARAVWREEVGAWQVYFGCDAAAEEEGVDVLLEGHIL